MDGVVAMMLIHRSDGWCRGRVRLFSLAVSQKEWPTGMCLLGGSTYYFMLGTGAVCLGLATKIPTPSYSINKGFWPVLLWQA